MKAHRIAAIVLTTTLLITGCVPDTTIPEPEPDPTPSWNLNTNFDRDDPCTLLTVDEIADAMGFQPGSVEITSTHSPNTHRPFCSWTFDEDSVTALDIRPSPENHDFMSVELVHFESPPACFDLPCATAADYLHAWSNHRYEELSPRTPDIEYRIIDSPHILSGAAAIAHEGVTFVDEVTYAHFIIYRCGSNACFEAIVSIQEAMGEKLS